MKHRRLRKRTKDSENGGGTEKASEKKTTSKNIEALYERLKTSVPKKSYQMNDLRKPYLVSLTFKYASSVANSNCFYGKNFFMNVQDMQNMATLF